MSQKIGAGLLACADKIWETADTLRGAGIKASEWPAYMMPFFALMMLESRLRRFRKTRVEEYKRETDTEFKVEDSAHMEWLEYSAKAANKGYHRELLLHGKGLKETCAVPGGNFLNRLLSHLDQYDPETKRLLGVGYAQGHPRATFKWSRRPHLSVLPTRHLPMYSRRSKDLRWPQISHRRC